MAVTHSVTVYALSTCVHCRRATEFLTQRNIAFDRVLVDKLSGDERANTLRKIKEWNPKISFPTIVIDDGKQILVGFDKEDLEKALA